jgi:hypothetical protein
MGDWARRGFLRGATGLLALGSGGALLARPAAALPPIQSRRTLLLDGAAVGPVLATIDPTVGVKYEEISFQCGVGMSKSLYAWLQAGPDGQTRRSGALVDASGERIEFTNALITELGMPALDIKSQEPALLSVRARPESTRRTVGAKLKAATAPPTNRRWLAANFLLQIDGLDALGLQVERVDALTIRQKAVRDSLAVQWEHPARADLEAPNLVLTLVEPAAAIHQWLEVSLAQRASVRAGSLAYLADDGTTELFSVQLAGLRPLRVGQEQPASDEQPRIKVELYCEELRIKPNAAALGR